MVYRNSLAMKIETITSVHDFAKLRKSQQKISTKSCLVVAIKDNDNEDRCANIVGGRFAVAYTVSKKLGGAVKRNKAKRRLRHALMEIAKSQPKLLQKGVKINFIAKNHVLDRDFTNLIKDIKYSLYNL